MMRALVVSFLLLLALPSAANVVSVKGYAPVTSGVPVARRQALVDAYRQAISAGGMIEVGSYSEMNNFMMVSDVVKSRVHGYIKSYRILSEGMSTTDDDIYEVSIEANVVNAPDDHDEQGLSAFLDLIGKPSVLFLVGEKAQDADSALEMMLAERFRALGYGVKTSSDVRANTDSELLTRARNADNQAAAAIARDAGVDLVLSGNVSSSSTQMSGGTDVMANLSMVIAQLNVVIPGNGKVLDLASGRARFMSVQDGSDLIAKERALQSLSKQLSEKLVWSIPQYLSQQPRSVRLAVATLPFDDIEALQAFLKTRVGIVGAELADWKAQTGQFQVDIAFTGPSSMDLVKVLKQQYPALTVERVRDYDVAVSL